LFNKLNLTSVVVLFERTKGIFPVPILYGKTQSHVQDIESYINDHEKAKANELLHFTSAIELTETALYKFLGARSLHVHKSILKKWKENVTVY